MFEIGDNTIDIAVGAFDNPNAIEKMGGQIGVESRVHWFMAMVNLPSLTTGQTRSKAELEQLKSNQHPDFDTPEWPPKP